VLLQEADACLHLCVGLYAHPQTVVRAVRRIAPLRRRVAGEGRYAVDGPGRERERNPPPGPRPAARPPGPARTPGREAVEERPAPTRPATGGGGRCPLHRRADPASAVG
jgi:hypothetical protein